jgi:murein DD-endopeptidase MepM/ murein hydrolase activator NlpD
MKISYPLNLPFHISQKWGENPEFYNTIGLKAHNGWDFAIVEGTPVYAAHDGVIQFAGIDSTMSLTVGIDSSDGSLRTLYCHLSDLKIKYGQNVKRGDLIALSGNTGRFTTGPHLHFGVRPLPAQMDNGYNGAADPSLFFDGTYPNTVVGQHPKHFTDFQKALEQFQLAEGLTPYPLVGPNTKKKLNKYLKTKYTI